MRSYTVCIYDSGQPYTRHTTVVPVSYASIMVVPVIMAVPVFYASIIIASIIAASTIVAHNGHACILC